MSRNSVPDCPIVADLIPGDPVVLDELADALTLYSTVSATSAERMRPMARIEEWNSEAAEGFVGQMEDLPKTLDKAVRHFVDAANGLRGYAMALRQAQADVAVHVIPEVNAARAWSAQWQIDREAVRNGAVIDGVPDKDLGKSRLSDAEDELGRIRARLKEAQEDFNKGIDKGIQAAPSGGDPITTTLRSFGGGAKDSVAGLVQTAAMLNPGRAYAEPGAYFTDLKQIATGYGKALQDPVGFAKDAVNWDEWRKDPARALGLTAPDLLASLLTGGGSKAVTIAKPDAPDPVDLSKHDRPTDTCESCGDPVDPVTGDVLLAQTDVRLEGALPLLIGRDHRSSYRHGRYFGTSWASTLDQHVEFDRDGVVFHSADGVSLRYPTPEPGEFVLPYGGARWPMAWDPQDGGVVVVGQPRLGLGMTFRPIGDSGIHALESIVDRRGNAIALVYDDAGAPIEVRHSGGQRIGVDTEGGRVIALRLLDVHPGSHCACPGGEVLLMRYGYSEAGDLVEVIASSGQAQQFTYDDGHRLTSWKDRNGTEYAYDYDVQGRCVRARGSDGVLSGSFVHHDADRITRYTNSLGDSSEYAYNERSQVERITDPLGNTVVQEWDQWHQLLAVIDQLGGTTRYTYDRLGNVLEVVRPDGTSISAEYDEALCLPVRVIGPDGLEHLQSYSAWGESLSVTSSAGGTTVFAYEDGGTVTTVTDPQGATTTLVHDKAGLPVRVVDPVGATTSYERDAWGRVVTAIAPDGVMTRQGWTVEGMPAWCELPDGARHTWTWDGEGNLVESRDAVGSVTHFEVAHFDLPAARIGPGGERYEFAYDTELRLSKVTGPGHRSWTYQYDPAGRLIAETDFNGREVTYRHDASGRIVLRSNGAAQVVSYERDVMGRVIRRRHEDTERDTSFEYDLAGRLIRATNPDVLLELERDAAGRITAERSNGRMLVNTYDRIGRRTSRTTPSGSVSVWSWDSVGRPLTLDTAGETMRFTYDRAGREIGRVVGEALDFRMTWDVNGRLLTQSLAAGEARSRLSAVLEPEGPGRRLAHREYTYNANGAVTSVDDQATGMRTFDVDRWGRITAVHGHDWSERYRYDATGNVTDASWPGGDTDAQGSRVIRGTLTCRAGRTRYVYDDQGRVISRSRTTLSGKTKSWVYSWDAEDRLTEVRTPTERWAYVYDPLGRRVSKRRIVDEGVRVAEGIDFTWDGTRLAEQTAAAGATTTWDYEPGTHRPLAQTCGVAVSQEEIDWRFHAMVTDLVGTPTELVSAAGEVSWRSRRTIWGVSVGDEGEGECPLRFPGQYYDPETDSNYNLFRYYQPDATSYSAPDPMGLVAGPNDHAYVGNPLTSFDPLGLIECRRAKRVAERAIERAQGGTRREAANYHGHLSEQRELEIMSNPDAVYVSQGTSERIIYRQGGDVIIIEGRGGSAGQVVTSYGPSGPRNESGAAALGGSPGDPGLPITHADIINGTVPSSGHPIAPATQIMGE